MICKTCFASVNLAALLLLSHNSHASVIAVVNGGFEQTLTNHSAEFGSRYPQQQITGSTSSGYNWILLPGTADTTGATVEFGGQRQLWGPGNGAVNGLTGSPDGGNYVAMGGSAFVGPLSQTLTGFTKGDNVTVSFWFAGAQQYGYNGATTEQLMVSLGDQTVGTEVLSDSNHGFTGWQRENVSFIASDSSEVLSFLAVGTPGGETALLSPG